MTDATAKTGALSAINPLYHGLALVAVVLVAAVYTFGFPLLITLAVGAAFTALAMIVGLTALDLVGSAKPAPKREPARRTAAQAA